jgi:hypothetical protein
MLKRNVVVLTIVAMVLGVGAYAWAQGAPERPTTSTAEPKTERARPERRLHRGQRGPRPAIGGRAVHGDLIVRGKDGFANVAFDKGDIVRHSATSVTLKRADGVEVTKAINGDTKFKGIASADEIAEGPALVVSKGDVARLVAQRSGDAAKRPR